MSAVLRFALFSAVFAFSSVHAVASDHGRTVGAFDVSAMGGAKYAIPIWTPPGPNGMTPSIALGYDSQGKNGVAGVGWTLAAVSSIERCDRTVGQDGADGAVDLSLNDRFCINGNRLRLISGSYGVSGSVYYTEFADFSRITAQGTAGNGPDNFLVEGKNGLRYQYGNNANARVYLGSTVQRWMLNQVSDRAGNNYVVSYNNATGFAVPDVISWTPSASGAGTYRYEAKFNYFAGRTDADSYFGKVAGYDVVNRNRLESIQIKSAGVVKRKYRLTYDTSSVTSRSRLTSFKECADDAETNCFLPTTFTYQMGQGGVSLGASTTPGGSSTNLINGRYDLNGDGKDDVVYWGGSGWNALLSSNTGFAGPYATGATASSVLIDKFLPIGRDAIATVVSGTLWTYRWDNGTSAFVSYNTGISTALPTTSLDYNGDRLADLVYFTPNSATLTVRANTSTGSGNPSFASTASTTASLGANKIYTGLYNYNATGRGLYRTDVNGDGRQDLNVQIVLTGLGGGQTYATILLGSSTGFDVPAQALWQYGAAPVWPSLNFNGDRCTDRWEGSIIKISACSGVGATSVAVPTAPLMLMDWDGDGKTDILVDNGGYFGVYKSTGVGLSSLVATSIPSTGTYFSLDQDGDGLDDLIKVNGTSPFSYWTHTAGGSVPTFGTNIPDLLSNVTDGFGVSNSPSYVSTAWSNYANGATTTYPLGEIQGGKVVVSQVTSSDGTGGTFNKTYFYVGARYNAARDEVVAFQRLDETDSRNGLISRSYFEQWGPIAGMLSQREVMQPNGVTPISRDVFNNGFAVLDATANNQRYFTFSMGSTATTYEVGGALNGSLVRTATTMDYYDNTSGALREHGVITAEPVSGANGVHSGGSWMEIMSVPVGSMLNDTANWCLGRPQQIKQTNSTNMTYGAQLTRTRNVVWDAVNCRPTQSVDEPGSSTLQVITDIGYDIFGNVSSSSVTGVGMTARTTTTTYANATFTTGQFPLSMTNALSETSSITWNYDMGVPLSASDSNGLTTSWLYDDYGRRTRETRPDSTYTTWAITSCPGCAPAKYLVTRWQHDSTGSGIHRSLSGFDQFDRSLFDYSLRPDNQYDVLQRDYDALGRVSTQYNPYINSGSMTGSSTATYDLLGRPLTVSRPISDTNPALQTTSFYYEGLTSRVVDAQGKQSIKVSDSAGQVVRSKDHDGYYQSFDYDAFGNITHVTDQLGNVLQHSNYNVRGMLAQRMDMDMGTWNFTPNALGETISQTDAKSQTTTFEFDLLGRLKKRTETEGVSEWIWGTSSAAKNIGQLAAMWGPGYSESYSYDSLGRPSQTTVNADTAYAFDYTYNNFGALDTLTYPTSTSSYRLKLKYEYQNGQLNRISDAYTPANVFWVATATNARGQLTHEQLGNGLITYRAFDVVTGRLKSIQTGLGGGTGVQNLAYEWDLAGNLKKRKDLNQSGLTEEFFYDNLYRLDYAQLNGATNLDLAYDALGNITSKSDVGSYTYHATRKHQVTSTGAPTSWSFTHDANGNQQTGAGRTNTWTSYNYLASVVSGANTATFSYTPDRQYWKQVSSYASGGSATTIYVGGLLEKVTTSAGTDFRHLIRAGNSTIIVSRQSGGTNTTNYVTSDHLGSSSAITNGSGAILAQSSFDAFGKRRGSNWSGSPSAVDWTAIAATTRRGYTEHTMLDNLALTHMNGRVQDPVLGRFLSADPFIVEPGDTQNYNRFSYVRNRALSAIDPSGFADGECTSDLSYNFYHGLVEGHGFREAGSPTTQDNGAVYENVVVPVPGPLQCRPPLPPLLPTPQPHGPSSNPNDEPPAKPQEQPKGQPDPCDAYTKDKAAESVGTVRNRSEADISVRLADVAFAVGRGQQSPYFGMPSGKVNLSVTAPENQAFTARMTLPAANLYTFDILGPVDRVFWQATVDFSSSKGLPQPQPADNGYFRATYRPLFPVRADLILPVFKDLSYNTNFSGCVRKD